MQETNDFITILAATWNLFNIQFTIYGFTISFAQVFLFSIIIGFATVALFRYLWG